MFNVDQTSRGGSSALRNEVRSKKRNGMVADRRIRRYVIRLLVDRCLVGIMVMGERLGEVDPAELTPPLASTPPDDHEKYSENDDHCRGNTSANCGHICGWSRTGTGVDWDYSRTGWTRRGG